MTPTSAVTISCGLAIWCKALPRCWRLGRRPRLCARHPVHVTMKLRHDLPSLRLRPTHRLVRAALLAASGGEGFRVVEYSVQTTHLHLLVEADDARRLSRGMNGLAVRLVRGLNRLWKRCGRVFVERYHARALKTPREVRNALVYVLNNARKHGCLWGRRVDEYSSAGSFEGWRETPETPRSAARGPDRDAESVQPWLVRARTWLLAKGWMKRGRIGVTEAPASG